MSSLTSQELQHTNVLYRRAEKNETVGRTTARPVLRRITRRSRKTFNYFHFDLKDDCRIVRRTLLLKYQSTSGSRCSVSVWQNCFIFLLTCVQHVALFNRSVLRRLNDMWTRGRRWHAIVGSNVRSSQGT